VQHGSGMFPQRRVQPVSTQFGPEEGLNNTATRTRPEAETTSRKNTEHFGEPGQRDVWGIRPEVCRRCVVTLRVLKVVTRCGSA